MSTRVRISSKPIANPPNPPNPDNENEMARGATAVADAAAPFVQLWASLGCHLNEVSP